MEKFPHLAALAASASTDNPVHLFRPHALQAMAGVFVKGFPGTTMYAVKTNPHPVYLRALFDAGVRAFDVASIAEVALVATMLPEATLNFMHPVKSRSAIREAYADYGVRSFSLDTEEELQKILDETNGADDLTLLVRLAIPNNYAELSLSEKFGIALVDAPELLRKTRQVAARLGVCFHVGSQCMHPDAYRIAIRMMSKVVREAGVKVDVVDVGGGFPSLYPGMMPPPMQDYFDAITEEIAKARLKRAELWCEPGRALVAEAGSVLLKVMLRKGEMLYMNDGTYGTLYDAGSNAFVYPVRLAREEHDAHLEPFSFYGPTCDSADTMKGPFYLPSDVREGDYIEVGALGAYGLSMVTTFNGFTADDGIVILEDAPLLSHDQLHELPEAYVA